MKNSRLRAGRMSERSTLPQWARPSRRQVAINGIIVEVDFGRRVQYLCFRFPDKSCADAILLLMHPALRRTDREMDVVRERQGERRIRQLGDYLIITRCEIKVLERRFRTAVGADEVYAFSRY